MSSSKRVALVVDDSRTIRTLLKVYLTGTPFECVEAESAEQALAILESRRVDVVLTDYNMKGMDGGSFVRTLRRTESTGRVPIIMMTSDPRVELEKEATAAGTDMFVRKPVRCTDLLKRIDSLVAASTGA